jgi:hypothetical protein
MSEEKFEEYEEEYAAAKNGVEELIAEVSTSATVTARQRPHNKAKVRTRLHDPLHGCTLSCPVYDAALLPGQDR